MANQLAQVIKLAKKTGDNVLVFDPSNPDDAYAVVPLNKYEALIQDSEDYGGIGADFSFSDDVDEGGLTNKEMLDRINPNADSLVENENINDFYGDFEGFNYDTDKKSGSDASGDDKYDINIEEYNPADGEFNFNENEEENIPFIEAERKGRKSNWSIPSEIKEGAEEVIEEDRQYIEEITF